MNLPKHFTTRESGRTRLSHNVNSQSRAVWCAATLWR